MTLTYIRVKLGMIAADFVAGVLLMASLLSSGRVGVGLFVAGGVVYVAGEVGGYWIIRRGKLS